MARASAVKVELMRGIRAATEEGELYRTAAMEVFPWSLEASVPMSEQGGREENQQCQAGAHREREESWKLRLFRMSL